jgi:hypothetical protein
VFNFYSNLKVMNYKLTDNKIVFNGETLYQIECIRDCKWAKKGELGGYIASYNNLEDDGWVAEDACVCDTSIVSGYLEEGCVAGNSVVEGKVKGVVIRNSFVDKDCDLENVLIINSSIYDSKYESFKKGDYPLTRLVVVYSCVSEVEINGSVAIFRSSVEKSKVEWQTISDMKIKEGYLMEDFEIPETQETGEVGSRRVNDEVVTKVDEDTKRKFEEYADGLELEDNEEEEYEGFEDLLNEKLGEGVYSEVMKHLDYLKTEKPQINSFQLRELNRMGFKLIGY